MDRATEAWAAGEGRLTAFFERGQSALDDADFLDALAAWTHTVAATLAPETRTLFHFLSCLEEEDRQTEIVGANWADFWKRTRGADEAAPELGPLLQTLAAVGLAIQTWRVGELSEEVEGLTVELQAAQTALDAYRGQLGEIRSSVEDLQGRMAALDELVNRDPLDTPTPETR